MLAFLLQAQDGSAFSSNPPSLQSTNAVIGSSGPYRSRTQLASSKGSNSNSDSELIAPEPAVSWTMEELDEQISQSGFVVSFSTFGPGYRAVARAQYNESLVLGYVEGFVRPTGKILHLDKMEVFKPMIKKARREGGASALDFGGISSAISLLLGYKCFMHGLEKGCTTAEFLAIDDEEFQHKRLVRYYRQFGFKIVKYVGEDIQDIPDRLVWGGCGTLMREEIPILLKKLSRLLTLMKARQERKSS